MPPHPDVVIVGAGVVGAACALAAARAGLTVTVLDSGPVAGGTTSAGEGNLLVSDKAPGPELDLALLSLRHWVDVAAYLSEHLPDGATLTTSGAARPAGGAARPAGGTARPAGDAALSRGGAARPAGGAALSHGGFELEPKGGLVVAERPEALAPLIDLAAGQRAAGVQAHEVPASELPDREPHLAAGLVGGMFYPQDSQLQPMLATARMLAGARALGAQVCTGVEVTGLLRAPSDGTASGRRVVGVRTTRGDVPAGAVINAAGTWAGELAALAGVHLPVLPRRGVVLVTGPVPLLVRHKVYAAEYVANVASDDADLQSSAVIEGTPSGTILIGASRERVGFDPATPVHVVRRLAAQAIRLFPVLAGVPVMRSYRGWRPYCPDHLPVIGADPRAPGLSHACGHEGAGIGLAAGTGHLLAQLLTGAASDLDLGPFRADRFERVPA
jgi:glycine/D-amino acid oxidase-like deaminating enzyme